MRLSRAEIAARLGASGLHELRLVDPVLDCTSGEASCVDTVIRALAHRTVRHGFPWRVPSMIDEETLVSMHGVCLALPSATLEPFALLAAAQHLPTALRRDAVARLQHDVPWRPDALAPLVHATVITKEDLNELRLGPQWVEFHQRDGAFVRQLRLLANAAAAGDDRTRLLAMAASKDALLDPDMSREIADVARRRYALLDFMRAARDFDAR